MKRLLNHFWISSSSVALICSLALSACKTFEPAKYSEFVRTTDFTNFDTFRLGQIEASTHPQFRRADEVSAATRNALGETLNALGYSETEDSLSDFVVEARWRLVSALKLRESMVLGPESNPGGRSQGVEKRYNLLIEVSDATGVFWVFESDDRLLPRDLTEARARSMVARAIGRFPTSTLFERSNP
ncbi:MAG: hypothetical protein AAGB06_03490 [Verrucomicrobiota bacterium]